MNHTYIKFKAPNSQSSQEKDSIAKSMLKKTIIGIASLVIPKANPDFDKLIDEVEDWLVEYDNEEDFVNREIGLNKIGKAIMIMPWKKNYGYWIDNDLKLNDFSTQFTTSIIDKQIFENYWTEFENRN